MKVETFVREEEWWTKHQLAAYSRNPELEATLDLERIKPVAFIHVPKCGHTFLQIMARLPGLCANLDAHVVTGQGRGDCRECLQNCRDGISQSFAGAHKGVDTRLYMAMIQGRGFIVLRPPELRIMSSWVFTTPRGTLGWPIDAHAGNLPENITEYAAGVQGCAVKMLTRPGDISPPIVKYGVEGSWGGPCGEGPVPSAEEVSLAKERLRDGFVFVGLTDHWGMTVCLLHAMFGGHCQAEDFTQFHHSNSDHGLYNLDALDGFKDVYDTELYSEAERIFNDRLRTYDLTPSACRPCFAEAGIAYDGIH